jgi:hypothetical protein
MYAAFPRSEYYNGAAPPAPSVDVVPIPSFPPWMRGIPRNGRRWFPRSRVFGRRVRHSAVPLRHRQRLRRRPSPWPPDPDRKDPIGSSPSVVVDGQICAATQPTSTGLELVKPSRGVTTPIPRVYLPISLTAPGPSGSTGPTRLCRGCSHPPRRPPDWIASSFTLPLRRQGDGRSFTSIRNTRASWRNYGRLTRETNRFSGLWRVFHVPHTRDTTGFGCPLYAEASGALTTDLHSPVAACRFSAARPCTPVPHPSPGGDRDDASTRVHLCSPIRRFPSPAIPGWHRNRLGFPLSFAPRRPGGDAARQGGDRH